MANVIRIMKKGGAFPSVVEPSGWLYQTPDYSGDLISYETFDNAYNVDAGLTSNPVNANPLHIARLNFTHATPFFKLDDINQFLNFDRFTDEDGLQIFGNDYIIDHLYNRAYKITFVTGKLYGVHLTDAEAYTNLGFSNFRCLNTGEWLTLFNYGTAGTRSTMNYAPFNFSTGFNLMSTQTVPQNDDSSLKFMNPNVVFGSIGGTAIKLSTSCATIYVRNHYT